MKLSTGAARQHVDYNVWATRRLLEAASSLTREQLERDFGTADRSILGIFQHLLRAEYNWLNRLQGRGQGAPLPDIEDIAQLGETWSKVHADWKNFIDNLSESDLNDALSYHDLKGNPWTNTIWEILLHVVNHSTHHRGQISGFLRASGLTPPNIDYIAYVRMKQR